MQVRDTSLNPLPLCLHCQEKQGNLIDRPCPKEQGALGERPGPAQGWALIAQRQEGPTSLSGRVMGRPSRWTEGLGPSGSQLCWENLPQERLVLRGTKMLKKTSLLKMRGGWGVEKRHHVTLSPLPPRLLPSLVFGNPLPTPCGLSGSIPAWTLGFPPWVSSLTHPEHTSLSIPLHSLILGILFLCNQEERKC